MSDLHVLVPRRRSVATLVGTFLAACALAAVIATPSADAFGTVWNKLGQHSEHERVTRVALQCGAGQQPPECFQPVSLDNLAGKGGSFGAVGAPDDLPLHLTQDRDYWHCDNADWVDPAKHGIASYPQARRAAMDKLRDCLAWGRDKLYDGGKGRWNFATATPDTGAVATAAQLIKRDGSVDDSNPGVGLLSPTCTYNGVQSRRAKCNVLEPFGYVLHMAEDFYSHTNWADLSVAGEPLSLGNPYGLGKRTVAPFLDLRQAALPADAEVPANFTGSCYPKKHCAGRVIHGESSSDRGLNKDKGLININTGAVTQPGTPRGAVVVDGVSNSQRAVDVAVLEVRRQWEVFRAELAQRYGSDRASKMVCALVLDRSETCDRRNVVVAIDTSPPRRGVEAASAAPTAAVAAAATPAESAGKRLIDGLQRTDRVAVVTFDSSTGDQDLDTFTPPSKARIDDAADGDRQADPSGRDDGRPRRGPDPTVTPKPGPAGTEPSPDGALTHGTDEGAETQPTAAAAQSGGDGPAGDETADALRSAAGLLAAADAPRGQQGVVILTNRIGDAGAVASRIRLLASRGAVVSLAVHGATSVPEPVVRAVEASGGVVAGERDVAALRAFADVADASGLTRLDDHLPGQDATLDPDHPIVHGITDRGADVHDVEALDGDATLTVRALEQPLTVVVTDAVTGEQTRTRATRDRPATVSLDEDGNHAVAIEGAAGRRYTATVTDR